MPPREQVIKKSVLTPTFLIAGGAGFIGSHLAEKLLEQQARVIVLDNFKTGKDIYVNSLLSNPRFALFNVDINQGLPKNIQSIDYIVHLAGVESYLYNRDQVNLDSLLTNAIGTKNLLDLAQKSAAKFLLVSSIDVYEGLISPVNLEQYFGQTPEEEKRYSLSEAKRFAEALVWEFYKKNQTNVRIVRIPEIYGPRMSLNSSGSMGQFLKEVMENRPITVLGDGNDKEYYLYISDVVAGIVKALFNPKTEGQIFTLAPEEPSTSLEIAFLAKSLADSGVKVEFKDNVSKTFTKSPKIPDRGNLALLNWQPRVALKEGLRNTMVWFGYEPNEHTFKPAKLIESKNLEKEVKTGKRLISLAGLPGNKVKEETSTLWDDSKEGQNLYDTLINKKELPAPKSLVEKFVKKPVVETIAKISPKIEPKPKAPTITENKIPWRFSNRFRFKFAAKNKVFAGILAALGVALVLAIIPAIQTYQYANSGVRHLEDASNYLMQLDTEKAKDSSNKAFQSFHKAGKAFQKDQWVFLIIGKKTTHNSIQNLLSSATYFSKGTYNIAKGTQPFSKIWEVVKPNTQTQFNSDDFSTAQINFNEAKGNLQMAEGSLKNVDRNHIPTSKRQMLEVYTKTLGMLSSNIEAVSLLSSEIPNMVGAKDTLKRYMVLFQNSNEIRPTGGFIGSYAIMEFQNGKIQNLTIDDIYNPDGQIDVRNIDSGAPNTASKLLGENKLYIRNANWDPDFTKSAETIKNLYFQVTDKQLDGVLAVDLKFTENILKVTGPVYLTAFGEEISDKNLYERTQFHSEFNYENGSDQKRAFLTILGSKLLEAVFALPNNKMPELAKKLATALSERHLMIYLSNSVFNSELEKRLWDGSLVPINPNSADYLYVVNANVGGTKANYFVKNDMQYSVSSKTRDGLLRAELKLTYNHTGTDNSWPGGPYKNYVRVLTQAGAKLTGASFQITKSDGEGQTTDVQKDIVIDKVGDYVSFEKLVEVSPTEKATLTLYYDLPQTLSITKDHKEYAFYWQKQPGTSDDNYTFNFEPPFGMTAEVPTGMNGILNKDLIYSAKLR